MVVLRSFWQLSRGQYRKQLPANVLVECSLSSISPVGITSSGLPPNCCIRRWAIEDTIAYEGLSECAKSGWNNIEAQWDDLLYQSCREMPRQVGKIAEQHHRIRNCSLGPGVRTRALLRAPPTRSMFGTLVTSAAHHSQAVADHAPSCATWHAP